MAVPRLAAQVHESMHSGPGGSQLPTHIFTDTRGQNGMHEATKIDTVVVVEEEKKHCTLNTPFCCAPNQQFATHSRRISPSDASTAE